MNVANTRDSDNRMPSRSDEVTTVWAATAERCANQAFNINNGDLFRRSEMWPKIARYFDLDVAPPLPMSPARFRAATSIHREYPRSPTASCAS